LTTLKSVENIGAACGWSTVVHIATMINNPATARASAASAPAGCCSPAFVVAENLLDRGEIGQASTATPPCWLCSRL
jgi:hypothetical protein